jgi:hypothetical protein
VRAGEGVQRVDAAAANADSAALAVACRSPRVGNTNTAHGGDGDDEVLAVLEGRSKSGAGFARPNPLDRVSGGKLLGVPRPLPAHVPAFASSSDYLHGPQTALNPRGLYHRLDLGFDALYAIATRRAAALGRWKLQLAVKEVTADGFIVGGLGIEPAPSAGALIGGGGRGGGDDATAIDGDASASAEVSSPNHRRQSGQRSVVRSSPHPAASGRMPLDEVEHRSGVGIAGGIGVGTTNPSLVSVSHVADAAATLAHRRASAAEALMSRGPTTAPTTAAAGAPAAPGGGSSGTLDAVLSSASVPTNSTAAGPALRGGAAGGGNSGAGAGAVGEATAPPPPRPSQTEAPRDFLRNLERIYIEQVGGRGGRGGRRVEALARSTAPSPPRVLQPRCSCEPSPRPSSPPSTRAGLVLPQLHARGG